MDKYTVLKTLEQLLLNATLCRNTSWNGEWVNFGCLLAPYSPEHKYSVDKNPSAGITYADDGMIYYKCFTCKHQGPFSGTLERLEIKSKRDLSHIKKVVDEAEEIPDYELLLSLRGNHKVKPDPLPFQDVFEKIENYPAAGKYLADRNISPTTANKIGLVYDPEDERIVFPVKDRRGIVYGYTGRAIRKDSYAKIKDYYFRKSLFILGVELWNPDYPIILVEGLFAYAHLHEISKGKYFPYNIGAVMGSNASPEQVDILNNFGAPLYCLFDNDKAGQSGQVGTRDNKGKIKKKGLIFQTKDNIPTYILRWPKETVIADGKEIQVEKSDPDSLTFEELSDMLMSPRLIV